MFEDSAANKIQAKVKKAFTDGIEFAMDICQEHSQLEDRSIGKANCPQCMEKKLEEFN